MKLFIIGTILVLISAGLGYFAGTYHSRSLGALEEYKVATSGLSRLDAIGPDGSQMLREYLKARQYYYSRDLNNDVLIDTNDRGPVLKEKLRGIPPFKDVSDFDADYRDYRSKIQR